MGREEAVVCLVCEETCKGSRIKGGIVGVVCDELRESFGYFYMEFGGFRGRDA